MKWFYRKIPLRKNWKISKITNNNWKGKLNNQWWNIFQISNISFSSEHLLNEDKMKCIKKEKNIDVCLHEFFISFYFKFIHRSETLYILYIYICIYVYIYIVTDCWYNDSIQRSVSLNSIAQRKEICSKKGKRGTCYFHFFFSPLSIFSRPLVTIKCNMKYYSAKTKFLFTT